MQRLAKPIDALRLHYDVIIIGSGYGGGVAASRLSRCGKSVCVLERGKEYLAGDFPDSLAEAKAELQISQGKIHAGARTALFDLRLGEDVHVFTGCGLGGTSLINANVSQQPDPRVFEDRTWPDEIRQDDALQEGYARAVRMLKPAPFPANRNAAKQKALENAARKLGLKPARPPLNIAFENRQNAANVAQPACTSCGDCLTGCNVGAKNTVHLTYLTDAANHGAEIFAETDVRYLRRDGDKWRVTFELPGHGREKFGASELSIWADLVVLSAGSLGTTEILLRSRDRGLRLSDQLGRHFSANGEGMAFSFNNEIRMNATGIGTRDHARTTQGNAADAEVGPATTSVIDMRKTTDLDQGVVIHDGAFPSGLAAFLPSLFTKGAAQFTRATDLTFSDETDAPGRILKSQFHGPRHGAIAHTQMLMGMGHDGAAGQMVLEGDRLRIKWPTLENMAVAGPLSPRLQMAAGANGGRLTRAPLEGAPFGDKPLTMSPLGGCRIGHDRLTGVVNHKCQVFDGAADTAGNTVHEGLYICDGAVVPRSLGVHPLMTIAALAERAMIHLALDHGFQFSDAPKAGAILRHAGQGTPNTRSAESKPTGVEFVERMGGYVSTAELEDYQKAVKAGEAARSPLRFNLTVLVDDIARFSSDTHQAARVFGTVHCPVLSTAPMEISHGAFKVLLVSEDGQATRHFDYRMTLTSRESGEQFYLAGHKVVATTSGQDFWENTARLYVDIFRGRKGQGGRLARGILNAKFNDFLAEIRTIKGTNGPDSEARRQAAAQMGKSLAGPLYQTYGAILAPSWGPGRGKSHRRRELRLSPPVTHDVTTEDGHAVRLTRFKGGKKGAVLLVHDIGTSSQIFCLDTVRTCLVEFLYAAGYDCWLLDNRASAELPYASDQWSLDDVVRHDIPAAIDRVQAITGHDRVQVVAQGVGAMMVMMAQIRGASGLGGVVALQAGVDVVTKWFPQRLLAYGRALRIYQLLGADRCDPRARPARGLSRLLDAGIGFLARPDVAQPGGAVLSNRYAALFGTLHNREEVSQLTRAFGLPFALGPASVPAMRQFARMSRKKHLVDAAGRDSYMSDFARLDLPMCFIHGSKNQCIDQLSSKLTYERLLKTHGRGKLERHVISDYGHLDGLIGDGAVTDVFPIIVKFLERTRRQ